MSSQPILDSCDLAIRIANAHGSHQPQPRLTTSPISTLPLELLSEIFLLCLPQDQYPIPSQTSAPLLLTHVNTQWRNLALALPDLWSSIHINYRCPIEDVPAVNLWLSHSQNNPLSLSLAIDFGEQNQQAIVDALCKHSARWKHIRFDFRHLHCPLMYNLALALSNSTPMLSTFEFHARDISSANIIPITQLLSTSPRLHELTWVDDLADTDALLALPLPRLTRLSLAMDYGSLDYRTLLDQCANLEHVRLMRPRARTRVIHEPLVLNKLTSLNIAWDLVGVLECLVLPALKSVRIHSEHEEVQGAGGRYSRISLLTGVRSSQFVSTAAQNNINPGEGAIVTKTHWDPTPFIELMERSGCRVESLWVNAPTQHEDLVKCLDSMGHSLKSLTISGALGINSELVELLTPQRRSLFPPSSSSISSGESWDCLCPHLTELIIDSRVPGTCSLLEMVQGRVDAHDAPAINFQPHVSLLKHLRIDYTTGHQDVSELRRLASWVNSRRNGNKMDLNIRETRLAGQRGSSAGRLGVRTTWMYRRKVCASR